MQAKVEVIDLAYAKQLLEQNTKNRPVSQFTVERYARDMKAGRWNNNGQGIVLTPEGDLLDGQHRLHAIIAAQTPVSMLVVRGVPAETFITMDSGKARSIGDVLAIEGYVHTNILSGIAKGAFAYASGAAMNYNPTKTQLEVFVRNHPYAQEVAKMVGNKKTKVSAVALATVLFLGNERRNLTEEAKSFVDGVVYGEGLFKGDARLTLREWVTAQRMKERGVLTTATSFAAVARAWNAFASGKELLMIKGLDAPSMRTLPVYGFDRSDFADVPDVSAIAAEVRRVNLAKARTNLPKRLATPSLKFAAA